MFGYTRMRSATGGRKTFLYAAGAFNFGAALVLVLLARFAPHLLGVDAPSASQLLYVDLTALLVVGFGIGYVLGGRDLERFWPFLSLGALRFIRRRRDWYDSSGQKRRATIGEETRGAGRHWGASTSWGSRTTGLAHVVATG